MYHILVVDEGSNEDGIENQGVHAPRVGSVKKKCTDCEALTQHEYATIQPMDDEPGTTIMNVIHLKKTIEICSDCGKLALKK